MKEPDYIEAERCIEIRKRGKRGESLNQEDVRYCMRMYKRYPEWYTKTEARVFNETVPFGSNVRMKE